MERNENWEAAVREAYPLLLELIKIRKKYRVTRLEMSATNYDEVGPFAIVKAGESTDKLENGDLYQTEHYYVSGKWSSQNMYNEARTVKVDIGLPTKEVE